MFSCMTIFKTGLFLVFYNRKNEKLFTKPSFLFALFFSRIICLCHNNNIFNCSWFVSCFQHGLSSPAAFAALKCEWSKTDVSWSVSAHIATCRTNGLLHLGQTWMSTYFFSFSSSSRLSINSGKTSLWTSSVSKRSGCCFFFFFFSCSCDIWGHRQQITFIELKTLWKRFRKRQRAYRRLQLFALSAE